MGGLPGDQAVFANVTLSFPHQHQASASEVLELTLVLYSAYFSLKLRPVVKLPKVLLGSLESHTYL